MGRKEVTVTAFFSTGMSLEAVRVNQGCGSKSVVSE